MVIFVWLAPLSRWSYSAGRFFTRERWQPQKTGLGIARRGRWTPIVFVRLRRVFRRRPTFSGVDWSLPMPSQSICWWKWK